MRRTTALLLSFALVLVLAGCGSSSSDSSSGSSGSSNGSTTAKASSSSDDGYGSKGDDGSSDTSSADTAKTDALAKTAGLTGTVNLPDEADEQVATASGTDVEIELNDFYIGPTYLQVEGGTTLRATVTNDGDMPHTFTIDSLKIDEELQPGDTATVEIAVPASGALQVYCRFHKAGGMQGAIIAT